jgi:ABC-type molybdenum transport system ATPase subunit/photorepair protein PhrA
VLFALQALDLNKTVIETIQGASSGQSYNELRALLGQFLFKGDSVEKKVCYLSGGEKARLSLCCMMLTPANLLILDEPTNREFCCRSYYLAFPHVLALTHLLFMPCHLHDARLFFIADLYVYNNESRPST